MAENNLKLLAIDDNQDNLTTLKAVLQDALPGVTALTALTGPEGIKLAGAEDPDVILLDIVMPGMDGFEVCRRLKSDDRVRHIPVLFLTAARSDSRSRIKALEVGGEAFLTKPIDETELTAQIRVMAKIKEANSRKRDEEKRLASLVEERTRELQRSRADALKLLEDLKAENEARKKTEAALRESETAYRELVENLNDIVFKTDPQGVLTYVSPQVEDVLGYGRSEVKGLHFASFVHPDDLADLSKDFQDVMANRLRPSDFRFRTKSGEHRWLRSSSRPIFTSGRVSGIQGIASDITELKKSEDALGESEANLSSLFNAISEAVFLIKQDGEILAVNAPMAARLGESPGSLIGRIAFDYLPHDVAARRSSWVKEAVSTGEPVTYEDEWRGRHVQHNIYPVRNSEGVIDRLAVYATDITYRKRAERALAESESRYRNLIMHSPDAVLVDHHDRVILVNHACVTLFGALNEEDLIGKSPSDLVHPDFHEMARDRLDRVRNLGVSVPLSEEKIVRLDGGVVDVEVVAAPFHFGDGKGVHVILRDIGERKRARAERNRLMTAVEHVGESIIVTDAEGIIQYVNPEFEKITGYTRKEAVGQNLREFKGGERDESLYRTLWETISGGRPWQGTIVNTRKDGKRYTEESTISSVYDASGVIVNYVAVTRDVTERLELSKQLYQAQKMEAVGTLAGGVAHDFNNILQVALGYSELILGDEELPARFRPDLQNIRESARRGADLAQRLLTFSRKTEIKPQPLNLNRRINELRKMLERTIPKMIDIQLNLGPDMATVNADPTQVDQVIMNLAVNARDAMPEGGRLIIETANMTLDREYARKHLDAKPGRYVLLMVTDTGSGIDKDTLEHIFEPFYTTKAVGEGTGLGLAIVHGIVRLHGGSIRCYSEPGHGTVFKIYLPALVSDVDEKHTRVQPMPRGGSETILLVDDEHPIRDLGDRILAKFGYKVITASNGKEALEVYHSHRAEIALVILDLMMPEMGGKQCLEDLLSLNPSVKVVIASGYSAQGPAKTAIGAGAKGFVNKPYDMRRLLEVVRSVLDNTPAA